MSNRLEKVNSLLEHEISNIIARDFDFSGSLVTLTHVDATANLIEARAYISVMPARQSPARPAKPWRSGGDGGPEDRADKIIAILNKGVFAVQQKINKKLNMRPIPKIIFVKDEITAEAAKIEGLLATLKKEEK